jgi:prepilin-type N-terminal cleavage/methylation domain-containing protein
VNSSRGYSLTELMAGISIIGILAVASVPNISAYLRSTSSEGAAGQLTGDLRLARSRAVLEGNDYLVQFTSSSTYLVVDDDGGGNGIPGNAGYTAANRGNGQADEGEIVTGPIRLPRDVRFATVAGIVNPFTNEELAEPISFPDLGGFPTLVFHANGTAEDAGFVALQPEQDRDRACAAHTKVLEVIAPTGAVEVRNAGQ